MMTLEQLTNKAKKHWREFLPEMTRELEEEGTFEQNALAAAKMTMREIEVLKMKGYHDHEAEESALPLFILKKPENKI